MEKKINWGIIGCGDVTEVKSGPAFNKVPNSSLVAVMRRNQEKAKDYATRHNVPKWYTSATDLINDPNVNAIYVATPPSSHEEYAIAAIKAGKPVYVEKPMSVNAVVAERITQAAKEHNIKLSVAHYRRGHPIFNKVKELIDQNHIGNVRYVSSLICNKSLTEETLKIPKFAWRIDEALAGGGFFHDLSPHQLDLMYYFFGDYEKVMGIATNQSGQYKADDMVTATILFKKGVVFSGVWCFNGSMEVDLCEIIGDRGKLSFSFFDPKVPLVITRDDKTESLLFDPLAHVQQPHIHKVVDYFLGNGPNPCSGDEGVRVMQMIDSISKK